MNLFTIVALVIVLVTAAIRNYSQDKTPPTPTPEASTNASPLPIPSEKASPPTPTSSDPSSNTTPSTLPSNQFIYPGAEITSTSAGSTTITTGDSPEIVTSWYEDQIRSSDMNIKSFVKTKANGQVNNKLSGANSENSIEVTITQSDLTQIIIQLE